MATIPVFNPQTPFMGQIPGGYKPTLMIKVKGTITDRRGRCVIDFLATPDIDSGKDIVFHTSIRLDEKCLVRNSFINQRWGPEERYGHFGISHNTPFEIIYLAEFEHYKIAVNGHHIGVFRHRLPLHLVNFIRVSGEVKIDHILLEQDMQSSQVQHIVSAITTNTPAANHFSIFAQPPSYPYQPAASAPPINISYQPPTDYQQQNQPPYQQQNQPPYPYQQQPSLPPYPYQQQQNPHNPLNRHPY